ncbi:MAG: DUF4199 domain-containing protein [Bacteroidia bacterium]|nr:DUF4199 domain-containing protein [Bacteroidia bacterium]MCZ2248012.1 DUF4199 domain-containing protein [Bacteroidia bacterium]
MSKTFGLELKYALIITVFTLLWFTFENVSGLQDEYFEWYKIVTNIKLLIPTFGIWFAIKEFRMRRISKYSFQKGFGIGFRITIMNSILIIPVIYIFYNFINPDWYYTVLEETKKEALIEGKDALKAVEDAKLYFGIVSYTIQSVIGTFVFGTLISSILAFILKNRGSSNASWA